MLTFDVRPRFRAAPDNLHSGEQQQPLFKNTLNYNQAVTSHLSKKGSCIIHESTSLLTEFLNGIACPGPISNIRSSLCPCYWILFGRGPGYDNHPQLQVRE